jgi:hypothetical protein
MSYQYCTYCGRAHPTSLCPRSYGGSSARANLRCNYCGSRQHAATYCLKTAGGAAARRTNPNGEFLD